MRKGASRRRERYIAKLLYQYAAVSSRQRARLRTCEESMILVPAEAARQALRFAKQHARRRQFTFRSSDGIPMAFQFVGVRDLLRLGGECEPEEVWYEIFKLVRPMERRATLIPPEGKLNAMYWETPGPRGLERARVLSRRRRRMAGAVAPSAAQR